MGGGSHAQQQELGCSVSSSCRPHASAAAGSLCVFCFKVGVWCWGLNEIEIRRSKQATRQSNDNHAALGLAGKSQTSHHITPPIAKQAARAARETDRRHRGRSTEATKKKEGPRPARPSPAGDSHRFPSPTLRPAPLARPRAFAAGCVPPLFFFPLLPCRRCRWPLLRRRLWFVVVRKRRRKRAAQGHPFSLFPHPPPTAITSLARMPSQRSHGIGRARAAAAAARVERAASTHARV